jgi:mono/diheme cytochrome c family protein
MFEMLIPTVLIATAALLVWSGARAWRTKNPLSKWGGSGLAALSAAGVALIGVLLLAGLFKLHARSAPTVPSKLARTENQIRHGRAIADGFCSGCHSETGTMTGGLEVGKHFPVPIGSFVTSNLTPSGDLSRWSDGDIFRAIRNSVDRDGRWLIIMSYTNASRLSDEDIWAVIAYLRNLPAAGQVTPNPPDHLSTLGLLMLGAGLLPTGKPTSSNTITAPPRGPTAQYGEYIVSYQDCRECHGQKLTGGTPGQLGPLGPDLTLVKQWTFEAFAATMRTGTDPNGHVLGEDMPWKPIGRMDDEALRALYEYLTHLSGG